MYLVFDIGGTFIKYAWMNEKGERVEEGKFRTPYESSVVLVEKMTEVFKEATGHVLGIAISCPGTVNVETGMIYHGGSLRYLHETKIVDMLRVSCGVPVSVENDGKCAALAELWLGSVKGYKHAAVLVLGTGIGGGLIIDGKLHRGANLEAGELSYGMDAFNPDTNKAMFAGESGSASLMVNRIAKRKGLAENNGEAAFALINNKDPEAVEIFEKYCKRVAVQILNLQYIIDPEIIAIGGGISVQPVLLQGIKEAIALIKRENPLHVAKPNVVACKFRSAANLYGALYHFKLQHEA